MPGTLYNLLYILDKKHIRGGIIMAFFFWKHDEEKLKSFTEYMNKVHVTIQFTAEWFKTSIAASNDRKRYHWKRSMSSMQIAAII